MRRILPALAVLALVGCNDDVCAKFDGKTCIALDVRGGAGTTLSALHVVATAGFTLDTFDSRPDNAVLSLPVAVAIVPQSDFSGDFALDVIAQLGSSIVGQALVEDTVEANRHVRVVAQLDAAAAPDLAPPADMAQVVTADSECADEWVADMKGSASCAGRHAAPIDTTLPTILVAGVDRIHIARDNASGRVGIVSKGSGSDFDSIALVVSQFVGYAWPPVTLTTSKGGEALGDRLGRSPSIAVGGDAIHICTLDTSDGGNEVRHTTVDSAGAFIDPELVAAGQGLRRQGSDCARAGRHGRLRVLQCARLQHLRRPARAGHEWHMGELGPGRGWVHAALVERRRCRAAGDRRHGRARRAAHPVLGHRAADLFVVRRHELVDAEVRRQLAARRASTARDVHLAHYANTRAVTYFVPNGAAWDLRLATFASVNDKPLYSTVYPTAATTQTGAHHAAAYDSFGFLHVALITPFEGDPKMASLLYLRPVSRWKWRLEVAERPRRLHGPAMAATPRASIWSSTRTTGRTSPTTRASAGA